MLGLSVLVVAGLVLAVLLLVSYAGYQAEVRSSLRRRLTVAEARESYGQLADRLLEQMANGDELWEFLTSARSWRLRRGRGGLALVRSGDIVASVLTKMS